MDDLFGSAPTPPPAKAEPPKKAPKPPTLYPIPATARRSRCAGERCGREIFWVDGNKFPISANPAFDGFAPGDPIPDKFKERWAVFAALIQPGMGMGISHYVDCPDAKTFSHRKKDG